MSFIKRSLLYCMRQRIRTLILFLVLTCLATFALTGIAIQDATMDSAKNLRNEVGGIVRLEADTDNGPQETVEKENGAIHSYVGDWVTDDIVAAIKKIDGVASINAMNERGFWGSGVNFEYIPGQFNMDTSVPNTAVLDSEKSKPFQSGKFTLEQGRHIREDDKNVIIISKEVAERNNLNPGDMITLYNLDTDSEVELEIVGIYSGAGGTGGDAMLASDVPENAGFVDFTTMNENFGREIDGFPSIDIHVNDPAKINDVYEKVKNLPEISGKTLKAELTNEEYEAISNPLESMQSLVKSIVTAITVVSVAILGLLLFLWTRARRREVGILLAVGNSKQGIIGQLLLENSIIALLAFISSYYITQLIADKVCAFLISQTEADVSNVIVGITTNHMTYVYGIGILAICLCVAIASYGIIRFKPKDILSKID